MTNETVVIDAEFSEVETTDVDIVQALTVLPEQKTALDVFKNVNNEAEIILSRVKEHFSSLVFDMSTAKGRAECRAQAALIRKIKAKMEEIGKSEAAELKLLPKKVDTTRNFFKDKFEELAIAVRAPLTAYEAEEERKKTEEKAKKEAEDLARRIERDYFEALIMNAEFDAEKARIKAQEEEEQKQAAEKLKREAEEKAKADAEYQSQLAIQQAKNAELEAIRAKEQVEKEKAEALAKAEEEKQAEIARINAQNEAKEKARLAQVEAERLAKEKKEAEAEAKRQNIEHQRTINRAILAKFEELGLDTEMATVLLKAMVKREIPNVTVNY